MNLQTKVLMELSRRKSPSAMLQAQFQAKEENYRETRDNWPEHMLYRMNDAADRYSITVPNTIVIVRGYARDEGGVYVSIVRDLDGAWHDPGDSRTYLVAGECLTPVDEIEATL